MVDTDKIILAQAVARRFLQTRLFTIYRPGYSSPRISADVPNGVTIEVAVRKFLYALVTRKASLFGQLLNVRTVRELLANKALKFASYRKHSQDSEATPKYYNYGWVNLEWSHGMHEAETAAQKRTRLASNGAKKGRMHSQPSFITHDILSHIAKFLPVQGWAAMCAMCHGAGFCLPRNYLRKQLKLKLGYLPTKPLQALRTYSAARNLTNWKHTKTLVFSWDPTWANSSRHAMYDRIVHLWCTFKNHIHFITRQGMCGTYVDDSDSVIKVIPMAKRRSTFYVLAVSIGSDNCICVLHSSGLSIYSNTVRDAVTHVHFNTGGVHELACFNERNAFITHGTTHKVSPLCFQCESPHMRCLADTPEALNASLMKVSCNGVIWKSRNMRVCRMARAADLQPSEITPRLPGRGRIVYISDMLPSRLNAVLHAIGKELSTIAFTDGFVWAKSVDLKTLEIPLAPSMHMPFSTAGDMVLYRDRLSRKLVSIRPEYDGPIKAETMVFAQTNESRRRRGRSLTRDMYLINNAVFVVENKCKLVKYLVD